MCHNAREIDNSCFIMHVLADIDHVLEVFVRLYADRVIVCYVGECTLIDSGCYIYGCMLILIMIVCYIFECVLIFIVIVLHTCICADIDCDCVLYICVCVLVLTVMVYYLQECVKVYYVIQGRIQLHPLAWVTRLCTGW